MNPPKELGALITETDGLGEAEFVERFPHPAILILESAIKSGTAFEKALQFLGGSGAALAIAVGPATGSDDALLAMTGATQLSAEPEKTFKLGNASRVVFLEKPVTKAGRAPENDVCFPLNRVSRTHAIFEGSDEGWKVTDNRAANGTFVNDTQLEFGGTAPLVDGTRVRISPDVEVHFYTPKGLFALLASRRKRWGFAGWLRSRRSSG